MTCDHCGGLQHSTADCLLKKHEAAREADRRAISATSDPEYRSRIEAQRVTLEMRSKSTRRIDGGKQPIEDGPLFGGPRQGNLF
jgi:hypothetical protein